MAFRLPDQTPQRLRPYPGSGRASTSPPNLPQPHARADEEDSQEWVLFSPVEARSTATHSHTASTERTPRLSDFESLETAAQSSGPLDSERHDGDIVDQDGQAQDGGLPEDDVTELDSLDDGLQAFRDPQLDQSGGPAMLPTHDGLGTFSPSGANVQEQLWQHEQFNPRRIGEARQRRTSSMQRHLDSANDSHPMGIGMDRERWQRIEQWRMEQSKVLLQEIEKETRRRRQRKQRAQSKGSDATTHPLRSIASDDTNTTSKTDASLTASQAADATTPNDATDSDESFWQRITRRVINGLIGIDDSLLAVIFGEALISDLTDDDINSGTSPQNHPDSSLTGNRYRRSTSLTRDGSIVMDESITNDMNMNSSTRNDWWEERLLERIARELGILVNQIYEHPGAFTAYMRTNVDPSTEYAGMPISQPTATPTVSAVTSRRESHSSHDNTTSILSPTFLPTLQDAATSRHAAHWGIEEDAPTHGGTGTGHDLSESERRERDREYWERELNIKMVFRYLRNRFVTTATGDASGTNNSTSTSTAELTPAQHRTQRQRQHDPIRAAIIRQHHPLVARAEANSRFRQQPARIYRHHHHHVRGTASPSCASQSQSTRKSVSTKRTGSSRHYWDIGGSAGSSSAPLAVGGGMGSWGDI
ncbi:hypothetical protein MGYG_02036 [Nannizzia gypsea CBS 118893]|uniref:Uncharacterized protein n=1 Tax=Arthroderma gypseum (strain ATCC MYA-4604 / CBS 118893) TaxID=535722 RepID=E4UPD5_ARTGP|nr:hypothetical protein MGYG_02036 [Nannizzia gypsea CBS 118893]EFQ99024.1 hypothetical protein MGYG_02036 [Nannizzia gypsea CBS 118893]